jgi:hypothetical protein
LGAVSFTVVASDGKGSPAKLEVPLQVIEAIPNRAPSITSSPRQETRNGSGYYYKLTATDPDGDHTRVTLVSAALGMTVNQRGCWLGLLKLPKSDRNPCRYRLAMVSPEPILSSGLSMYRMRPLTEIPALLRFLIPLLI